MNKKILTKILLGSLLAVTFFAASGHSAQAALSERWNPKTLFDRTAYCGDITDTGNDDDSWMRYGFFCYLSMGLQLLVLGVLFAIGWFFAMLLHGFTFLTLAVIRLGIDIITKFPVINTGFKLTLGVANILFIVALIILAFATILRWHEYEAKKMLPRLIIAALLVNFSFFIAGLFLDVSNVFTNYFITSTETGLTGEDFGSALDPQSIFSKQLSTDGNTANASSSYKIGGGEHSWEDFMRILPRTLMAILVTFLFMMAMIAAAIMALVRNIYVVILLILMPLVWGFWVLPKMEEHWKKWWENFLNWGLLYLPTLTFFMWLAVRASEVTVTLANPGKEETGAVVGMLQDAFPGLVTVALIIAGLKISKKMGAIGAAVGLGAAAWAGGKVRGGMIKGAKKLPGAAAGAATRTIGGAGSAVAGLGRGFGKGMAWGGPIGGLGGAIGGAVGGAFKGFKKSSPKAAGQAMARGASNLLTKSGLRWIPGAMAGANALAGLGAKKGEAEEYQKKNLSNLTNDQFDRLAKAGAPSSDVAKAAMLAEAEKRHRMDKLNPNHDPNVIRAYAEGLKRLNPGTELKDIKGLEALAKHHPAYAPELIRKSESEVRSKMTSGEIAALDPESFDANNVFQHSAAQLAGAAGKNKEVEDAIRSVLAGTLSASEWFGDIKGDLDEVQSLTSRIQNQRKIAKKSGKKEDFDEVDRLTAERTVKISTVSTYIRDVSKDREMMTALTPQQREAVKISMKMDRNIGGGLWGGGGGEHKEEH